ncbi:MAG: Cof-type HAD-IIB family hydrolase [Acidimicrobiales bacterium]
MLPLVCIDVDGTLVGETGSPSAAVWAATEAAVERGQHLALCTARGAFGKSAEFADRLDPAGWHIFHAGASLIHSGTGEEIKAELGLDQVEACADAARANDWVVEFYSTRQYSVDTDTPAARAHAALLGVDFECSGRESLEGGIVRAQFVVDRADTHVALAAAPSGTRATSATSPIQPGVAFVSIVKAGVNKGTAITALAELLDTTAASVMMIGDGHNDVDALTVVGHPVAMGNADEAALAVSDHVVATVAEDGVVEALELSTRLS